MNIFLGKWVCLVDRSLQYHPRAFLQMFNIWLGLATRGKPSLRMLAKALGFINWHFRPQLGGAGGPQLLLRPWGGFEKPTPVRVLEATAIVRCMEPWRPPQPLKCVVLKHISSNPQLADPRRFMMCCDAAMDGLGIEQVLIFPVYRGLRTSVLPGSQT